MLIGWGGHDVESIAKEGSNVNFVLAHGGAHEINTATDNVLGARQRQPRPRIVRKNFEGDLAVVVRGGEVAEEFAQGQIARAEGQVVNPAVVVVQVDV